MDMSNLNVDVDSEILAALRTLEADYQKNGKQWRCPSNPSDPKIRGSGNIIGSEALLCFLLPLSALRARQDFRDKVFSIVNEDSLRERVETHLLSHKDRDDFTGHPYTLIIDLEKKQHPFIDSFCFIISILILYAELFGKPENVSTQEHFKFLFKLCLEGIKNSAIKGSSGRYVGFFVTDKYLPEVPFKYPTWMAIDTLSDLRSLEDISMLPFATAESIEFGTTLLDSVLNDVFREYIRIYIEGQLTDKEKELIKGRNVDLTKDIVREDADDNSPHYNLWATIILLHLTYSNTEKLAAAFKVLMPYVDEPKKFRTVTDTACKISFFSDKFPAGEAIAIENVITDRCFLPQYVKGLSLLLKNIPRLRSDEMFLTSLEKSLNALLKNRKKDIPLWDKFAEGNAPYAVYQTERAIESLCALVNLRVAIASESTDATPQRRSSAAFDRDLIDAVLKHAIVIRVGEDDARSLISREIADEMAKTRNELSEALGRLATILDNGLARLNKDLPQGGKSGETAARGLGDMADEILGWADEFKVKPTKKS